MSFPAFDVSNKLSISLFIKFQAADVRSCKSVYASVHFNFAFQLQLYFHSRKKNVINQSKLGVMKIL